MRSPFINQFKGFRQLETVLGDVSIPDAPETDENVNSIDADGWQANYTNPPTFDPVNDKKYVVSQDAGHNASGNAATITRNLEITSRVRQPYPNQASLTTNNVSLADLILSTSSIVGVTNNSTIAAPKTIAMWLDHDLPTVFDGLYTARLVCANWFAQNGRPVAAVEITATDGTTTISSGKITSMSKKTWTASGLSAACFEHAFNFSTLDPGLITLNAIFYPWIGPSTQANTDYATYPSINFCEMKVLHSDEGPVYAYVDGVGAGTPDVSENAVTAATTPYADVNAALAAIQAYNNTNFTRNNATGGIVRLTEATHTIVDFSGVAVGDAPPVIEAADVADKATTIFQNTASGGADLICDKIKFKDITIKQNVTTDIFLDNAAGGSSSNMLVTENCIFDDNGVGSYWGAYVYRVGRWWVIECSSTNDAGGLFGQFSSANKMANLIGCNQIGLVRSSSPAISTGTVYHVVGTKDTKANLLLNAAADRENREGIFIGWNKLSSDQVSDPVIRIETTIGADGCAIVGNVLEKYGGNGQTLTITADGITTAAQNVVIQANTGVGNRFNVLYQDVGTSTVIKMGSFKFNVSREFNSKSDVFGLNGNLVGNWSVLYKVAARLNVYVLGDNSDDIPGPGSWVGEITGLGELIGTDATPIVTDWADDQSSDGGSAGDGDYTPGASTAIPTYGSTALVPHAFDLNGNALNASSHVGAIN